MKSILQLMRPHQYLKNLFIFAPLFFSGALFQQEFFLNSLFVFLFFSLTASAVYVLNDIKDVDEDRKHPVKCNRPIASGAISVSYAWGVFYSLLAVGLAGSFLVSINLFWIVFLYLILNVFYSQGLKHISILDVSIIAIGFVLRLFAGTVAIDINPSVWIILMTFLLALFLAFAKRRDDVLLASLGKKTRKNIEGYNLEFVNAVMVVMSSVVIVTYILYTLSDEVQERIGTEYLYLTVIFVIIGIIRYMQITFVEHKSGSPTKILLKDRFLQIVILLWMLSFSVILYGIDHT